MSDAKQQLKSIKKVIKDYEHDFFAAMGRKPGKADISDNPDIGNYSSLILALQYKYYNKLRKTVESNDPDVAGNSTPVETMMDQSAYLMEDNVDVASPAKIKTRPKSRIATGIMSNKIQTNIPITPKKSVVNYGMFDRLIKRC